MSKAYLEISSIYDNQIKKVLNETVTKQPDKCVDIMKDFKKLNYLRDFTRALLIVIMGQWSPNLVKAFEILIAAEIKSEGYQKFILNHPNKCIELAKILSFLKEAYLIEVQSSVPGVLNLLWQHVNKIDHDLVNRIEAMKNKRTLSFESLKAEFLNPGMQMNLGNFGIFKSADEKDVEAVHKTFSLV